MTDRRHSRPPPNLGHHRPTGGLAGGPPLAGPLSHGSARHAPPLGSTTQTSKATARTRRGLLDRTVRISVIGLGLLILAGAAVALLAPPTELIRDQLVAEVKRKTGRDLVIAGETRLQLLPSIGVSLGKVSLSAPPHMGGPPVFAADRIEVQLAIWPLILREARIERLVVDRPVLDLRVDPSGRRSWDFADAEPLRDGSRTRLAQAGPAAELKEFARHASTPAGQIKSRALPSLEALAVNDVRIAGGTVRYADLKAGRRHEARDIDAQMTLGSFAGALTIDGRMQLDGEKLQLRARAASLRDGLEQRPTQVKLAIDGSPLKFEYDGMVTLAGSLSVDGKLAFDVPSLVSLARLLAVPVPDLAGIGHIAYGGNVRLAGPSLAFAESRLRVGDIAANGSASVELTGSRPKVKATLRLAALDLDRLAEQLRAGNVGPQASPTMRSAPGATPSAGAAPSGSVGRFAAPRAIPGPTKDPSTAAPPRSIDDIIRRTDPGPSGPQVRGFTRRAGDGWSQETIEMFALRLIDFDGRIDAGSLVWQGHRMEAVQTVAVLADGVLKLDLTDAQLHGGRIKGLVRVDARAPSMTLGINLSGDAVAIGPLLKTAGVDLLDGRARASLAVSARGGSERELVGSLAGRAELHVADGALIGWDADSLLKSVLSGRVPRIERSADARTPFRSLQATYQITSGVARTQDLRLEGAPVRVNGSGLVNIVDRNIDMTLRTQASAATGLAALEVPVRVAGPWQDVGVVVDVAALMKSPQAAEAARLLGRELQKGNVEEAVRGFLGNDPKADEKIGKAKDLLRQFLGR